MGSGHATPCALIWRMLGRQKQEILALNVNIKSGYSTSDALITHGGTAGVILWWRHNEAKRQAKHALCEIKILVP